MTSIQLKIRYYYFSGSESTIDPDMFTTAEEDVPEDPKTQINHPPPQPVRRQLIPKKSRSRLAKTAFDNRTVDVSMEWEACQTNQGFNHRAPTTTTTNNNSLASPADWSRNFQTVTSTPLNDNDNLNGSYVHGTLPTHDEVDQTAYNTAEEDEVVWNTLTEDSNASQDHETTLTSNGNQNLEEWETVQEPSTQDDWTTVQEGETIDEPRTDEQNGDDAWGTVQENPLENEVETGQENAVENDSPGEEEWGTVSEDPEKPNNHEQEEPENQSQKENVWDTSVDADTPVNPQIRDQEPVEEDQWQSVTEDNPESSSAWASVIHSGSTSNDESTLEPDQEEPYSNTWDQPTDSFHTINEENDKVIHDKSSVNPWAASTSPSAQIVAAPTPKSPLKRTKAFKGESGLCDTEDLYCDDELNGDDPNMQLEIAKSVMVPSPGGDMIEAPEDEEAHARRRYPHQPVLVDQGM